QKSRGSSPDAVLHHLAWMTVTTLGMPHLPDPLSAAAIRFDKPDHERVDTGRRNSIRRNVHAPWKASRTIGPNLFARREADPASVGIGHDVRARDLIPTRPHW